MCTISYKKCVCFVFLVILAVLSCSGFRIDNLTMTDMIVNKRNSMTVETAAMQQFFNFHHRLRHRRQMPARRRHPCIDHYDVSWKAYRAHAIAIANIDSLNKSKAEYTVQFKIHQWLKKDAATATIDELIRLKFRTHKNGHCEYEEGTKPYFQIETNKTSKKYILYLNTSGPHNYTAAYTPDFNRTKIFREVVRVNRPNFTPKSVEIELEEKKPKKKGRKLLCKVKGFPIPIIYWKFNNNPIPIKKKGPLQIVYKNSEEKDKKKSILMIRNMTQAYMGKYTCVAESVDGKNQSQTFILYDQLGITPSVLLGKPCEADLKDIFCLNGGTCFNIPYARENSCVCPNGFYGIRCEHKSPDQSSMYRQTPLYTCTLGLFTKNDNCS